jgi:hypothetical protein
MLRAPFISCRVEQGQSISNHSDVATWDIRLYMTPIHTSDHPANSYQQDHPKSLK